MKLIALALLAVVMGGTAEAARSSTGWSDAWMMKLTRTLNGNEVSTNHILALDDRWGRCPTCGEHVLPIRLDIPAKKFSETLTGSNVIWWGGGTIWFVCPNDHLIFRYTRDAYPPKRAKP